MKKRFYQILCALIALMCMFACLQPFIFVNAEDSDPSGGFHIEIPENCIVSPIEPLTISVAETAERDDIQWQIMIPDTDRWVNISGETDYELRVTVAMTESMMNDDNTVHIRCKNGNIYSEPIEININLEEKSEQDSPAEAPKKAPKKAPSSGSGEAETYNIVVNYVFGDNSIAADPFVYTVFAGEDYSDYIIFPEVSGYEPYIGDDAEPSEGIQLDYTNVQSNMITTVYYKPTSVTFRVEHYLQNVENNDYGLYEVETKEGFTQTIPENIAKTYEGFYVLKYDLPPLAADGSTIIRVYYDRYYYLIDFDLQGGQGVDPIYAKYGSPIEIDDPVKKGYIFTGWDKPLAATVPSGGASYKAGWSSDITNYNVLFWYEKANGEGQYAVAGSIPMQTYSGNTVNSASFRNEQFEDRDDDHFTYDSSKEETVMIKGDGTSIVNVYFSRNIITMRFHYDTNDIREMSGRWESTFASNGQSWPSDKSWYFTNTSGGKNWMTFMDAYLPTANMPNQSVIDFYHDTKTGNVIYFLKEKMDGSFVDSTDTEVLNEEADNIVVTTANGTFTFSEKYQGFHIQDYQGSGTNYHYTYTVNGETHDYNGKRLVTTSSDDEEPQYGVVDGELTELYTVSSKVWRLPYTYTSTTSTNTMNAYYGIVSGEYVYLTYTNMYVFGDDDTPYEGSYVYQTTTSNSGTQFGIVNGNIVQLTRRGNLFSGYSWYYNNNRYNGTRYSRSSSSPVSTYGTYYGFVNGQMHRLSTSTVYKANGQTYTGTRYLRNGTPQIYTGTRYTREGTSAPYLYSRTTEEEGVQYGLDSNLGHQQLTMTEEDPQWYGNGKPYNGTRYVETDATSGAVYGFVDGERYVLSRTPYQGFGDTWTKASVGGSIRTNLDYIIRYARNVYDVEYYNYNYYMDSENRKKKYEYSLEDCNIIPPYPDIPYGKYTFAGWYDNQEMIGEPFDFSSTMPADNVTLFAKWEPNKYTVNIYANLPDAIFQSDLISTEQVAYGELATTPAVPENTKYNFVGWFYLDEYGEEHPFQFSSMGVTKDINIYGKWTSDVLVDFEVRFETEDGRPVADPLKSSALAGSTRTFNAATDLYEGFEEGWFPHVKSHSLLFDVDSDNVFTFIYRNRDLMPYTVRYLDAVTGEPVHEEKHVDLNRREYVTEKFIPIEGMIPDRFQKNLIISSDDPDSNVVIFYYSSDVQHAYYLVSHYIEQEDGSWKLYNARDYLEDIGTEVTADPIQIQGYTYSPGEEGEVTSGTVTADGLELQLFYRLNEYPYIVRYRERSTNKELAEDISGTANYGTILKDLGKEIDGYDLLNEDQYITITIEEEGETLYNILTYYYRLQTAEFYYVPVTANRGTVSKETELLSAVKGVAEGSLPAPKAGFTFVGWFSDPECTVPVSEEEAYMDENLRLIPKKINVDGVERYVGKTYYALFSGADYVKLPNAASSGPDIFYMIGSFLIITGFFYEFIRKNTRRMRRH